MAERHIYTVNLRPAKKVSRRKRAGKAIRILKEYVQHHSATEDVSISHNVNEAVWRDGAVRPPKSVEVQVIEEGGTAHVELADRDFEVEQPEEAEEAFEDLKDEEIAEMNVDAVKEAVEDGTISAERALDIEYAGKNRKTLIEWLDNRSEPGDAEEAEDEDLEPQPEESAEAEADEETYDLPGDALDVFRDGTIDEGKEAARELGKQEFEKLLNFEEAHQNRKGMKQFLRSNMN